MKWIGAVCLGVVLVAAFALPIRAAQIIEVHTLSGRTFRGVAEPRTDDTVLWLRAAKSAAAVSRPIHWNRITRVIENDEQYQADEYRNRVRAAQQAADPFADDLATTTPDITTGDVPDAPPDASSPAASQPVPDRLGVWHVPAPRASTTLTGKVTSVQIDAQLANWDSDVEADGLLVYVAALDAQGEPVPVLGTLTVDLIGNGATNLVSGQPFPLLGRWTRVIRPDSMGPRGAVVRLPFETLNPDFHAAQNVSSHGMVHARLSVAGHGVFEDTASFTRIRPYSPTRDRMWQLRGTRFHPSEMTGYR